MYSCTYTMHLCLYVYIQRPLRPPRDSMPHDTFVDNESYKERLKESVKGGSGMWGSILSNNNSKRSGGESYDGEV